MKRKRVLAYLLITVTVLFYTGCSNKTDENSQNSGIAVEVEQVKTSDASEALAYSGTIEESESIPLSFSGSGSVSRVLVSEGDFVKKGDLLATLNDESYKNAYEKALASKTQAEDTYNRLLPMYKNGSLPEIKIIESETSLQSAKSSAAIAKKNYDDCKLYSPASGYIGKRSIEPGMISLPNITPITVVKIEKVFARVAVSENEISSIKKGQKAKIKIAALNNSEFTGTVEEIGVLADPIAHTYKIKIGIINKSLTIKPGMVCNVIIDNAKTNYGLLVSNRAVMVDENGKNFVYTVDPSQNKAFRKFVKTGEILNNGIEIIDGLNSNEIVVVAGQHKLVDKANVRIVNK